MYSLHCWPHPNRVGASRQFRALCFFAEPVERVSIQGKRMTHFSEDLCVCVYVCACVCLCVFACAGMLTHPLLLCAYCMCSCIGLVSQIPSFAALVKRGATLMRRETDSVSAAPDRVCGPLWMKLLQSVWCASVER